MKKLKKFILWLIAILIVGSVALMLICNSIVANNADGKLYADVDSVAPAEYGLLLGTTPMSRLTKRKNYFFKFRIDATEQLYKSGKINKILISGDENSLDSINEVECMRDSLVARGVDASDIVLDGKGFRTLDSVVRAVNVYDVHSFIVISQQFHNERAIYLAEHLDLDVSNVTGYNATSPNTGLSIITYLREYLARVKLFIDILTNQQPIANN